MSFFSSLLLFYPGIPPSVTMAQLHKLGSELRETIEIQPDSKCTVQIKYGKRIDQDYETTNLIDWNEAGTMGTTREYDWDHSWRQIAWHKLPKKLSADAKHIYRAYLSLGYLKKEVSKTLSRWNEKDPRSGIYPDGLSIEIDPICPTALSDTELVCTGMISVNFPGNGYFSWGEKWETYARQYQKCPSVIEALRITRTLLPVPDSDSLSPIQDHLGDRFLNRDYYQAGDWILTVSETG